VNELLPLLSAGGGLGGLVLFMIALLRWISTDRKDAQLANSALLERLRAANEREQSTQALIDDLRRQMRLSEDKLIAEKRVLEQENFTLRQQVGAVGGHATP
jgi:hypothetical protein